MILRFMRWYIQRQCKHYSIHRVWLPQLDKSYQLFETCRDCHKRISDRPVSKFGEW
jgi:hypothetical protein